MNYDGASIYNKNKRDPVERLPKDLCLHLFEYLVSPYPNHPVRPAISQDTSTALSRVFSFPFPLNVITVSRSWQDLAYQVYSRVVHAVRLAVQVEDPSLLPSGLVPLLAADHRRRTYLERTIPGLVIADIFIGCHGPGMRHRTYSQTSLIPTICLREYLRYLAARQAPLLPQSIFSASQVQAPNLSNLEFQITVDMLDGLSDLPAARKREPAMYDMLMTLRHPNNFLYVHRHQLHEHAYTVRQRIQLGPASAVSWVNLKISQLAHWQSILKQLWLLDGGASLGYTSHIAGRYGPDVPQHFHDLATTCAAFSIAARSLGTLPRALLNQIDTLALVSVHNFSMVSLYHRPVDLPPWPYQGQCISPPCVCSLLDLWNLPNDTFGTQRSPGFAEIDPDAWLAIRHLLIIRHRIGEGVEMGIANVGAAVDALTELVGDQRTNPGSVAECIRYDIDMMSTIHKQWQGWLEDAGELMNSSAPFRMTATELEYPDPNIVLLQRLAFLSQPHFLGVCNGAIRTYTPGQTTHGKLTIHHFGICCS